MVNEMYISLIAARIQVELDPFGGQNKIFLCRQCGKAPCMTVCQPGAILREPEGKLVIDYLLCDNCKAYIEACPFQAIFWNPKTGRVLKCELCQGEQKCVMVCPTGALKIHAVSETVMEEER